MVVKEPWVEQDKFGKVKFAVIQTVSARAGQGRAVELAAPGRPPHKQSHNKTTFPPHSMVTPPTP